MAQHNTAAAELSIITININGGLMTKLRQNRNGICDVIKQYDVILLQNTHVGETQEHKAELLLVSVDCQQFGLSAKAKGYLTCFSSNERGVGIIINTDHKETQVFYHEGDYIGVSANIRGHMHTCVSIYLEKDEQQNPKFVQAMKYKRGVRVIGGQQWLHNYTIIRQIPREKRDVPVRQPGMSNFYMLEKDIQQVRECRELADERLAGQRATRLCLPLGDEALEMAMDKLAIKKT